MVITMLPPFISSYEGIIQIFEGEIKKFIKILQMMHNVCIFGLRSTPRVTYTTHGVLFLNIQKYFGIKFGNNFTD